jgi:glyoxylase-like metal-dependent hydrolase (beta-lactamase superfamily II)
VPAFVCITCGVQHAESPQPPERCAICEDERQYVGWEGQRWTTVDALSEDHTNVVREVEPGLMGIGTSPAFAIGQRALLVQAPGGNVLWDCVSLLDEPTVRAVEALGGVSAMAISHPHFYASMAEWSRAFGGVPIHLHAADAEWVMRPDPAVVPWHGERLQLAPGLTLVRLGGHFPGATVLHWAAGAAGRGALLAGDTIMVVQDRSWVSFMYSFPNLIPLGAADVRRIASVLEALAFDAIHSAWWDLAVSTEAKSAVRRSVERYLLALGDS